MQHSLLTDPNRHKRRLLKAILLIIFMVSLVIGSINLLWFQAYSIGALNYISMALCALIWLYYQHTHNLRVAVWLVSGAVMFNLASFIVLAQGGGYSLIWLTVLPPLVFFLLGKRAGSWVTAIFFAAALLYFYTQMPHLPPQRLATGAFLNIAEVMLVLFLIFRFYEGARSEAFAELVRISTMDKLTGIYNRAKLDDVLEQHIELMDRSEQPLSIMLLDLDHFKVVNDQFGHLQGDKVLQEVTKVIKRAIRKTDQFGRWGGEEFMLICPNTSAENAACLAEKLRAAVQDFDWQFAVHITVSIGIAEIAARQSSVQALQAADKALYRAKNNGRNRVEVAGHAMP
ncbi:GGDEF domain-containing protein [Aliidiomarina sp.]|uniref:GGDEF domain-containing protein n=1 Tax=Aliidiomarina sp. TaxID=1872439 RepID=UPI003A4DF874